MSADQGRTEEAPAAPYPRPQVNADYAPFHDGIQSRRLLIQECVDCGRLQHPPSPMCPHCNAIEWRHRECSGRGRLHSYTVHHHPPIAAFKAPHPVALVDMEEGFRLLASLHGVAIDRISIGMPLKLEFAQVEPDYVLFRFVDGSDCASPNV